VKHAVQLGSPVQYRHDPHGPLYAAIVIGDSKRVAAEQPGEATPYDLVWLAYFPPGEPPRQAITRLIDSPGSPGWQYLPEPGPIPRDAVLDIVAHFERGRRAHAAAMTGRG
jgi:hypothetical protein